MKKATELHCTGDFEVSQLRQLLFDQGCIMLGIMNGKGEYLLNPPLKERVKLGAADSVIVFAEN